MNNNYSDKCEEILNSLDGKKRLLLHSCCGPCSSYVITYLTKYFDITILCYIQTLKRKMDINNPSYYLKNIIYIDKIIVAAFILNVSLLFY